MRRLLVIVAVLPLIALVAPAAAQTGGRAASLRLVRQDAWPRAGEATAIEVDVDAVADSAAMELFMTVYRRVSSRTEFTRTLTERPRFTVVASRRFPLTTVERTPQGAVRLPVPVEELRSAGVYPVHVELRDEDDKRVTAAFTTHVVHLPVVPSGPPLQVALVLPLDAPPATRPDGRRSLDSEHRVALAGVVAALATRPTVPLTLRPTPETLEALEGDAGLVDALAGALAGRQLIGQHYVPVDLPVLLDDGLEQEATASLLRGSTVTTELLGRRPDTSTWVATEHLTERAVQALQARQVERLVLPEGTLAPVQLATSLTAPFALDVRAATRTEAAAADPSLGAHFTRGDDPVLAAHQLLADLAVLALDRPGRSRGVVAVPPVGWRADPAFVTTLLDGLAGTPPLVQASTLDDWFDSVPPQTARRGPLVRRLAPRADARDPIREGDVLAARRSITSFRSVVEEDNLLPSQLEAVLLASLGQRLGTRERAALLAGVSGAVRAQLDLIRAPADRAITLTARTGEVPITIRNETGYPVRIRIVVASDTLEFPDGADREVELAPANYTERFRVRARSSGSFPLRVRIETPDGSLVVAQSRFTVRSTAASGIGIALSVGAAAFLLLWWASHFRGRRSKRLVPA